MSGARRGNDSVGDLAIVLHSHMPYVEGFGTYPFGEEWLFEAYARSHLPVLDVARDATMSVTPVLADQLEAPGVAERLDAFLREFRIGSCAADAADVEPALRDAFARKNELVFLDFITDQTENVYPMIPGGKGITEMILSEEL